MKRKMIALLLAVMMLLSLGMPSAAQEESSGESAEIPAPPAVYTITWEEFEAQRERYADVPMKEWKDAYLDNEIGAEGILLGPLATLAGPILLVIFFPLGVVAMAGGIPLAMIAAGRVFLGLFKLPGVWTAQAARRKEFSTDHLAAYGICGGDDVWRFDLVFKDPQWPIPAWDGSRRVNLPVEIAD